MMEQNEQIWGLIRVINLVVTDCQKYTRENISAALVAKDNIVFLCELITKTRLEETVPVNNNEENQNDQT